MVNIQITDLEGKTREIQAEEGLSLMESIRDNDFDDLQALCGGCCSCCTCHVHVDPSQFSKLPAMLDDERDLVEDSDHYLENSSRLSCQVEVSADLEGLKVTIAQE